MGSGTVKGPRKIWGFKGLGSLGWNHIWGLLSLWLLWLIICGTIIPIFTNATRVRIRDVACSGTSVYTRICTGARS